MTADRLLLELRQAGLTVEVADGSLRIGPREKLTAQRRERIRAHKADLQRLLTTEADLRCIYARLVGLREAADAAETGGDAEKAEALDTRRLELLEVEGMPLVERLIELGGDVLETPTLQEVA